MRWLDRALPALVLLFASVVTAAASHAVIAATDSLRFGAGAYHDHAHGAFGPMLFGVAIILGSLLFAAIRHALRTAQFGDPMRSFLARFESASPSRSTSAIAAGGFALLLAMEFGEQIVAYGHIRGVGDALGGNVCFGLLVVLTIAGAIACAGLRIVRGLLAGVLRITFAIVTWLVANRCSPLQDACAVSRPCAAPSGDRCNVIGRLGGLRAPPSFSLP